MFGETVQKLDKDSPHAMLTGWSAARSAPKPSIFPLSISLRLVGILTSAGSGAVAAAVYITNKLLTGGTKRNAQVAAKLSVLIVTCCSHCRTLSHSIDCKQSAADMVTTPWFKPVQCMLWTERREICLWTCPLHRHLSDKVINSIQAIKLFSSVPEAEQDASTCGVLSCL